MGEPVERSITRSFNCYYDLFVPEGKRKLPLLIALHGYGGDKSSMMRMARRFAGEDFVVAALQGPHQHLNIPKSPAEQLSFGFGWLSNFKPEESVELHHLNLNDLIAQLGDEDLIDPAKVFLFGFSQAVALNFRYVFSHPHVIRGVVAVSGGIPGDWNSEGKYFSSNTEVLVVSGEKDEYYQPEQVRKNATRLAERALSVRVEIFDAGHEVPREAFPLISEWLRSRMV